MASLGQFFKCCFILGVSSLATTSIDAEVTWPGQNDMVRYESELTTEMMETVAMERILLSGPRNIQMDLLDGMTQIETPEGYSVAFTSPYNPLVTFGLSVFKASIFSPVLEEETMLKYLGNLSKQAVKNEDESFEILMEPEPDGGRTVFRFLNAKPFTIRYAYTVENDNGSLEKIVRQESWVLLEGNYYVVTVEAPEKNFDSFLATVKQPASSMHFIDS
ncbi:hypothetical protein [Rubellicoccus peritrichatus]|uniref:Uncharacterized protein n=1 Tax=Rubellicoccus peritrichatus TaxID=3080537 RepID=A0AAQ3L931_9BACT|nr:hypothetical protein [Puniceicoccus sp. CR14]WOO39952.1 hypothetical protein RZN69_15100 [Puniceicoccus sp. CR14]